MANERYRRVLVLLCHVLARYVYLGVLHDGSYRLLVSGVAFALSGFAGWLPEDRRRLAGALGVSAVGILVLMVISLWLVPETTPGEYG